jgi:hypothetical protein
VDLIKIGSQVESLISFLLPCKLILIGELNVYCISDFIVGNLTIRLDWIIREKCVWEETPPQRWIINQELVVMDNYLFQGFWQNDTAGVFNLVVNNWLQNINYSWYCQLIFIINNTLSSSINPSFASWEVDYVFGIINWLKIEFFIHEEFYISCKEVEVDIYINWRIKMKVIVDKVIGGDSPSFDWPNPSYSLFGNLLSTAIFYIILAAIVITGIVIGIVILHYLISHCQARGKGGRN